MNPSFVDLRPNLDVVEDQGLDGACTGFAASKAMDIIYDRAGIPKLFSPKYVWAKERIDAGVMPQNVGVGAGEIFTVLEKYGVCLASTMPNDTPDDFYPTTAMDAEATQYRTSGHVIYSLQATGEETLERAKTAIAKGIPVAVTMRVKESFFGLTGPWQLHTWDGSLTDANPDVGLHEFVLAGFADSSRRMMAQNSWGSLWADGGFFGVPYEFLSGPNFQILIYIELKAAGVRYVNAGWRPDTTPQQHAVQQAYIAYFGRPADLAGLDYWAGVYDAAGMTAIIDAFAGSAEAHALYAGQTAAEIITQAYHQLFGRAPDAPGLAYWANLVTSGSLTMGGVVYAIVQGAQGSDAESIAAKVEAAGVLTYDEFYVTSKIPTARAWLAGVLAATQVQAAVEALP